MKTPATVLTLFLALVSGFTLSLFSVIAPAHEITAEQRKQKIETYEKMSMQYKTAAECLKQNKPLDECNTEAMKGCPMMGKDCPFMEKGHMDKEAMREHMKHMKDEKSEPKKAE
jgi:predicted small metal-binding protein